MALKRRDHLHTMWRSLQNVVLCTISSYTTRQTLGWRKQHWIRSYHMDIPLLFMAFWDKRCKGKEESFQFIWNKWGFWPCSNIKPTRIIAPEGVVKHKDKAINSVILFSTIYPSVHSVCHKMQRVFYCRKNVKVCNCTLIASSKMAWFLLKIKGHFPMWQLVIFLLKIAIHFGMKVPSCNELKLKQGKCTINERLSGKNKQNIRWQNSFQWELAELH